MGGGDLAARLQTGGILVVHVAPDTLEASVVLRLKGHDDEVQTLAWSADMPGWIASGGRDSLAHVWDAVAGGAPLRSYPLPRDGAHTHDGTGGAAAAKSRLWVSVAWARTAGATKPAGTDSSSAAAAAAATSAPHLLTGVAKYAPGFAHTCPRFAHLTPWARGCPPGGGGP